MFSLSESETRQILLNTHNPQAIEVANSPKLLKALTGVLVESMKVAEQIRNNQSIKPTANQALALSNVYAAQSNSQAAQLANFAASQSLKTLGMSSIFGMTPSKAYAFVSITMAEKVVSAAGLAPFGKCPLAIAALATSTGAGAFGCLGTAGLGCFAAGVAVALDSYNVYQQCHK
ncbi:MAG: hypothetical protein HC924_09670 [Synechococcaceae cyanobacterium SM2_3_2]|nr:hypothetical protein [Synechococcaceae cyanobacterium SM2_3_2]